MKKLPQSTLAKAAAAGLLILVASFAGKSYFDQHSIPETKKRSASTSELLKTSYKALESHHEAKGTFPANAGWTPQGLPCGQVVEVSAVEANHPTWKVLGIDLGAPTSFQFRFRLTRVSGFELLARTDHDCDGVYEVHRLEGEEGKWGGINQTKVELDNPGE